MAERKQFQFEGGKYGMKTKPCNARTECRHRKHGWTPRKERLGFWPKAW